MKKKPIRNPFNAIPPITLTHAHTQRNNIQPQHPPPYTHKSPREGVKIHQDVITVGIPRISYKSTLWSENYLFPRILRVSWLHGMFELWDSVAAYLHDSIHQMCIWGKEKNYSRYFPSGCLQATIQKRILSRKTCFDMNKRQTLHGFNSCWNRLPRKRT